jgi:hypothetical protein
MVWPTGRAVCDSFLIGDDQNRARARPRARRGGAFTRLVWSQRLRGITQRDAYLWLSIRSQQDHRAAKAMGRSREPPAFARFGRTSEETKVARMAGCTPKRLPSGLCEQTGLVNVQTFSSSRTSTIGGGLTLLEPREMCQFVWVGHHENVFDSAFADIQRNH